MPPERPKKILGLPKNIFMLGLTSFFNDFSNEMILAAFPAFFTSVLQAGAASLGLVEGIADGASNFLGVISGRISDKIQKRRIFMFIGYGLAVAVRPFYMLTTSVAAVLGLRVTDRVGKGLRDAPRDVIISASAAAGETGRSFGYHRAMDKAGAILGPLAAYFILLKWPLGFNTIFLSAFLIGIAAVATIFFVTDVAMKRDEDGGRLISLASFRAMPPAFKAYLAAVFLLSVGSLPVAVLLLRTSSIGLIIASIPLFYMIYNVSYSGSSYFAGKLSDRAGTTKVIVLGYLILLVSYATIGGAYDAVLLALAFLVLGMSDGTTDATQAAWVSKLVPAEHRGTAYGLYQAAYGFGIMTAGIAGGALWQAYSPAVALLASGGVVIAGLVILLISMVPGSKVK